jgi:hypothetical protein
MILRSCAVNDGKEELKESEKEEKEEKNTRDGCL